MLWELAYLHAGRSWSLWAVLCAVAIGRWEKRLNRLGVLDGMDKWLQHVRHLAPRSESDCG